MKKNRPEPFFRGKDFIGNVSEAIAWYRKFSTPSQQKNWLIEFVQHWNRQTRLPFTNDKPFSQEVIDIVNGADEHGCIGLGSIARLLTKGVDVDAKTRARLMDQIRSIKQKEPRIRKQSKVEINQIRQQIDETLDSICLMVKPKLPLPSREKWRQNLTQDQQVKLSCCYSRLFEEVESAASEEDVVMMEAYSNLNIHQMDALVNYLRSVVEIQNRI